MLVVIHIYVYYQKLSLTSTPPPLALFHSLMRFFLVLFWMREIENKTWDPLPCVRLSESKIIKRESEREREFYVFSCMACWLLLSEAFSLIYSAILLLCAILCCDFWFVSGREIIPSKTCITVFLICFV